MVNILETNKGMPNRLFSIKGLLKNFELIPVTLCCGAALGFVAYITYHSIRKNDVIIDKAQTLPPWERQNLSNPKTATIVTVNKNKYKPNPELNNLLNEIYGGQRTK